MTLLEDIIPYSDVLLAPVVFILSLVIAKIVDVALGKIREKITLKTSTILDDVLLQAVRKPLFLAIAIGGLFAASKFVPMLQESMPQIGNYFIILFIVLGAYTAVRILNALLEWYAIEMMHRTKTKKDEQFLPVFRKIGYSVIYVIAFVWVLNQLGIEITTLIATLGIAGIAVALALQDTLSNFFAGAYIVLDRPVKAGDYIELETGDQGYVEDIGWRSTKIRTLLENLVIIPNSVLAQSKIKNYFGPVAEMNFIIPVGVSYDSDLEKVEKVTMQVAKETMKKVPGGVPEFTPKVRFKEFGDSNINFKVILRAKRFPDKYAITDEFIKALKKKYDAEKIEIAFPCTNVYMRK